MSSQCSPLCVLAGTLKRKIECVGNLGLMGREWISLSLEGMFTRGYIRVWERVWWRWVAVQDRDKDTAGSTKAKPIHQSTGNWWVLDQRLRYCCYREDAFFSFLGKSSVVLRLRCGRTKLNLQWSCFCAVAEQNFTFSEVVFALWPNKKIPWQHLGE